MNINRKKEVGYGSGGTPTYQKSYVQFELVIQDGKEYIFIPYNSWMLVSNSSAKSMIFERISAGQLKEL